MLICFSNDVDLQQILVLTAQQSSEAQLPPVQKALGLTTFMAFLILTMLMSTPSSLATTC
jgi:hypothetical protein